jgi:hypothetical protein
MVRAIPETTLPDYIGRNFKAPVCAQVADYGTATKFNHPLTLRQVDNPTWLAPEKWNRKSELNTNHQLIITPSL